MCIIAGFSPVGLSSFDTDVVVEWERRREDVKRNKTWTLVKIMVVNNNSLKPLLSRI